MEINFDHIDDTNKEEMEFCIGHYVKFCDGFDRAPSYTTRSYIITSIVPYELIATDPISWVGRYLFRIVDIKTGIEYLGIDDKRIFQGFATNKFKSYPEGRILHRKKQLELLYPTEDIHYH